MVSDEAAGTRIPTETPQQPSRHKCSGRLSQETSQLRNPSESRSDEGRDWTLFHAWGGVGRTNTALSAFSAALKGNGRGGAPLLTVGAEWQPTRRTKGSR